jgi:hypothetical protein
MKNKLIIFPLIALLGVIGQACESFLEEELVADVSASSYYTTAAGLEDAVKATYSEMKPFFGPERGFTMTSFGTDVHMNGADGSHKAINRYDGGLSPTQSFIRDTWRDFYRGINQANAVINRAAELTDVDEDLKQQRLAEVRFLRAFYYFILTETYGDIHLSLEETEGVETTANRTSQAEIYSQAIIPDLNFAINTLDDFPSDKGRASKPAAQFLLGKALLTRSYRPFAEPTDALTAEALFTSVIEDYGFELADNYRELFGLNGRDEAEFISTCEDLPEHIFLVQNSKSQVDEGIDGNGHRGHLYFLFEYDVRPGMLRDIANGRPWKRFQPTPFSLSLWDRDIDRRYDETYKKVWYSNNEASIPTWTQEEASNGYVDAGLVGQPKYEVGDTAVFFPGPGKDAEWPADRKARSRYLVFTSDDYTEKIFPSLNKWIDDTRPDRQKTQGQRDFYLMRLGEAYLLRAEARLQQDNTLGATEDINVIRTRAAVPGMEAAMQVTTAQVDLDFLLDERARELDGEGQRWWDLVRTGKLVERVRLHNPQAAPNIQDYHIYRPIPQDQIDRTEGGYEQNCGYPGASC